MSATYIEMILTIDGVERIVWQKTEPTEIQIVIQQTTTYVDANDQEIELPSVYEMKTTTGQVLSRPHGK